MSEPRHRLEPGSAPGFASYPPPNVRSIDFDAVAPQKPVAAEAPTQYVPTPERHTPTGTGPDQWAEEPVPESAIPEDPGPDPTPEPEPAPEPQLAAPTHSSR